MVDLLKVCCLMVHIWPQLQAYLGTGPLLDSILEQWKIGNLGWQNEKDVLLGVQFSAVRVMWFYFSASQINLSGIYK